MNTYSALSAALLAWLNREGFTELENQAENLIAMGQRRIHRDCDLNAMEEAADLTIDAQTVNTPTGFLRTKSLFIEQNGGTFEIQGADHHAVMKYSTNSRPTRYSVIGDEFYFSPPPDGTYTGKLVYFKALPILSSVNTTNWISENVPELLLFAAMVEACHFLKDDARAQVWEEKFQRVKQSLMMSEERMDKPYGEIRVRAV